MLAAYTVRPTISGGIPRSYADWSCSAQRGAQPGNSRAISLLSVSVTATLPTIAGGESDTTFAIARPRSVSMS